MLPQRPRAQETPASTCKGAPVCVEKGPSPGPLAPRGRPKAGPKPGWRRAGPGQEGRGPACGRGSFSAAVLEPGPSPGRRHWKLPEEAEGEGEEEKEEEEEKEKKEGRERGGGGRAIDRQIFWATVALNNSEYVLLN